MKNLKPDVPDVFTGEDGHLIVVVAAAVIGPANDEREMMKTLQGEELRH